MHPEIAKRLKRLDDLRGLLTSMLDQSVEALEEVCVFLTKPSFAEEHEEEAVKQWPHFEHKIRRLAWQARRRRLADLALVQRQKVLTLGIALVQKQQAAGTSKPGLA